jgi:hypothetical protein
VSTTGDSPHQTSQSRRRTFRHAPVAHAPPEPRGPAPAAATPHIDSQPLSRPAGCSTDLSPAAVARWAEPLPCSHLSPSTTGEGLAVEQSSQAQHPRRGRVRHALAHLLSTRRLEPSEACAAVRLSAPSVHQLRLAVVARPARRAPGDFWFVGETYLKVAGRWTYLYRAGDQGGQVTDVLLSAHRDLASARRFFTRALKSGTVPVEVTTDRAWCTAGPRRAGAVRASHGRAVPEQPDRGCPRPVEGEAASDARHEAAPFGADHRRRARVRAERPTRPFRDRSPMCLRTTD